MAYNEEDSARMNEIAEECERMAKIQEKLKMNKNQIYEKNRYQRAKDAGICTMCRKAPVGVSRSPHRPNMIGKPKVMCDSCYEIQRKLKDDTYKEAVLRAYGYKCVCCGISDRNCLVIDHINDDGHIDRKQYGYGNAFYRNLIKLGYPDHVQLLCSNCHASKNYGQCTWH